jgi:ankyrin repeat protein
MPGINKSLDNVWILAGDGKLTEIQEILEHNSLLDANLQDEFGYSPLHAATSYGHIELIRMLVKEYNANINIADRITVSP